MASPELPYAEAILTAAFVAVGLLEHIRPERPATVPAGRRWSANLLLFALGQVAWLLLAPLLAVLASRAFPVPPILAPSAGPAAALAHGVAAVLIFDLVSYVVHRLSHAWAWLWRLHALHHTDLDLDVSTTLRHHPFEIVPLALALAASGALLGASEGEFVVYGLLSFAVQLVAHANLDLQVPLARALSATIVTPRYHQLHHSRDPRECHANYGQLFILWDRFFGTLVVPSGSAPSGFGVTEYMAPRFQRIGWMLLQPISTAIGGNGRLIRGHNE
jgi:sterol desaturase/sphingolipid hydroxylase (fatty acid hydroxylase superfamily)